MRKILISECLLGERIVRYDGKSKALMEPRFLLWKEEGRLVPVCPEVCGGLPVPRVPSEPRDGRMISKDGQDVTAAYEAGAKEALRLAAEHDVAFAVLKQSSPACGSRMVHDGSFSGRKVPGMGIAARLLSEAGYIVFDENQIEEAAAFLSRLERKESSP